MTKTIQRLADRMVARLVPATEAQALTCWYMYSGTCARRLCCDSKCYSWEYTC
ncbi:hypothetical protein [Microbispora sp. NPDC049125]|uniref:hypothetical protein n=1 Tax=Microbispora sp. NPDC049125 TaxID=3154929 RepID=UPI003466FB10